MIDFSGDADFAVYAFRHLVTAPLSLIKYVSREPLQYIRFAAGPSMPPASAYARSQSRLAASGACLDLMPVSLMGGVDDRGMAPTVNAILDARRATLLRPCRTRYAGGVDTVKVDVARWTLILPGADRLRLRARDRAFGRAVFAYSPGGNTGTNAGL